MLSFLLPFASKIITDAVNKIPEAFEVDLDGLQIGDSIHVSSIKIDEEVKLMVTDRDFTIATIAPPTVIAVEEEKVEGGTEADEKDAESEESQTEDKKEEPDKKE